MRARLQAGVFHGFTLDESGAPAPESAGNLAQFGLQARHMAEYETQHAGHDPRLAATLRIALGGVMLDHEHFSAREALRNPVYADWLIPLGLKHTAGVVVRQKGCAHDLISFMRPRDAKPYSADDKRFIERLLPDIARAAKLRARMLALGAQRHPGHGRAGQPAPVHRGRGWAMPHPSRQRRRRAAAGRTRRAGRAAGPPVVRPGHGA